jgi:hypothetical protein
LIEFSSFVDVFFDFLDFVEISIFESQVFSTFEAETDSQDLSITYIQNF